MISTWKFEDSSYPNGSIECTLIKLNLTVSKIKLG